MKLVSILIPVYNTQEYLEQCVMSVIKQSYKNLEVILVDDGSTDKSDVICDIFAEKDDRIRVIHKKHEGIVSARLEAAKLANGSYVMNIDSDDYIDSDMIGKLVEITNKTNADIICSGYIKEKENGSFKRANNIESGIYRNNKLNIIRNNLIFSGFFYQPGIMPFISSKMIKKEIYLEFQSEVPLEVTRGEDVAVMFPLLLEAKNIIINNNLTHYHYRKNPSSICHRWDEKHFEKKEILYKYLDLRITDLNQKRLLEYYKLFGIICGMIKLKEYVSIPLQARCTYLEREMQRFSIDKEILLDQKVLNSKYSKCVNSLRNRDFFSFFEFME